MSYTVTATAPPTRITLLDGAGGAAVRWTLQAPEREGRSLRWKPEGVLRTLGSGQTWRRIWRHRGFRQELGIRWSHGLISLRETWTGATWSTGEVRPTAEAHSEILDWAARLPVQVEPFLGTSISQFQAQVTEKGPSLQDTKGVAHPRLELVLAATALVSGVFIQRALGWGIGPWGLLPWGD